MRRTWWILTLAFLLAGSRAAAQQGYVQVISAMQVTTGDIERTGATRRWEPDFGFSWFAPGTRVGTVQFDLHAVRGKSDPRLGRALFAIRDLKSHGFTWNLEAGDTVHTPFLTDYGFSNLFAPQVTFRGGSVSASGPRSSFSVTAGRVTVLRDLFGANAEALGQSLFVARGTHRPSNRVEISARASRVRTEDLKEFAYVVRSGDDAGAGVRVSVTPSWQIVGDAGVTSFLRRGSAQWELQPSMLAGTKWTGQKGWIQVDAHRFSPGNFSVVTNPHNDREGVFAAGQYDLGSHVRAFGGWDVFRSNVRAETVPIESGIPQSSGSRAYGGVRVRVNAHLFFGGRVEQGARTSRPSRYSLGYESDTGVASGEWQITYSRWNATGRYERRSNVDVGSSPFSFTQHDASAQVSVRLESHSQVFANVFLTDRRDRGAGGQSFWQVSAGSQVQLPRRNLFARAELTISRNRQIESDFLTPRTALGFGLNGQLSPRLTLSIDTFIDRAPLLLPGKSPWASRTLARLVYTLPTGSPVVAGAARPARASRGRETIEGVAFVDWNGNGVQDADDPPASGVTIVLDADAQVTTDQNGRFRFPREAAGPHRLALDLATLPADYDPPSPNEVPLVVRRGARTVTPIGLLPLGDVEGTVFQDTNGNGALDADDRPIDDAVVVLDDGTRTEVTHGGRFRFTGVPLGPHTVRVLVESLPDGASLATPDAAVELAPAQRVGHVAFLAKIEKRPEIRKVFPPKKDGR
jgi:hypothetical protein